jgi:methylmalonyl-CoA/ethylmalonyl-CoA epimerase
LLTDLEEKYDMLKKVHHINFLVRDLDKAVSQYQKLFGATFEPRERLEGRGVVTARFRLGEVWIILVEPVDANSVPGKYLEQHGEGFFLISYEVEDVEKAAKDVVARGGSVVNATPRRGLENWKLIDIDPTKTMSVPTQLVECKKRRVDS